MKSIPAVLSISIYQFEYFLECQIFIPVEYIQMSQKEYAPIQGQEYLV